MIKQWTNGSPKSLSDDDHRIFVGSTMALAGSDVYVAGSENGVPKYWKTIVPML